MTFTFIKYNMFPVLTSKHIMQFTVHPKLAADSINLGSFRLCEVLLMNDSRFPWIVLIPRIPNLQDFHEIPTQHQDALFQEIEQASTAIQRLWSIDKMNVAALGNQVSQLHIHVIGRRTTDEAWPNSVWGAGTPCPYSPASKSTIIQSFKEELPL